MLKLYSTVNEKSSHTAILYLEVLVGGFCDRARPSSFLVLSLYAKLSLLATGFSFIVNACS